MQTYSLRNFQLLPQVPQMYICPRIRNILTDKLGETLEYLSAQIDLWAFFIPLGYPTCTPGCWYWFPEAQMASFTSLLAQSFPRTNNR